MPRDSAYFEVLMLEAKSALSAFQVEGGSIDGFAETYVLGSLEQLRVTVASQQVRAINLIDAIWKRSEAALARAQEKPFTNGFGGESLSLPGQRFLVVGTSAAGLTAAAFAAQHGADVTIIDRSNELLSRFRNSERWIDPRLYEWGAVQPYETARNDHWKSTWADIPLLSWGAAPARDVAAAIEDEWEGWERLYAIKRHMGVEMQANGADVTFVHANGVDSDIQSLAELEALKGGQTVLILALGFGEEHVGSEESPSPGYWAFEEEADRLENMRGKLVLIEGNGDGAITDLFRLLVKDFTQATLRAWVEQFDPNGTIVDQVLKIEVENRDRWCSDVRADKSTEIVSIEQAQAFWSLACPELDAIVRAGLRRDNHAWLSVRPVQCASISGGSLPFVSALHSKAFPLNKVILASLLRVASKAEDSPLTLLLTPSSQDPDVAAPDVRLLRTGPTQAQSQPIVGNQADRVRMLQESLRSEASEWPSRRTPWASKGEASAENRPRPAAYVTPLRRELRAVHEQMSRTGFNLVTDLFDSPFQFALHQHAEATGKPNLVHDFFLGCLRTMMLFNDRILLTDAQVWDGRFMLNMHRVFHGFCAKERMIFQEKLELRLRPTPLSIPDRLSAIPDFSFGSMSPGLNGLMREFPALENEPMNMRLGRIVDAHTGYKGEVVELTENWERIDRWIASNSIKLATWPNATAWNVGFCYENPGQMYRRHGNKQLLQQSFAQRPDAIASRGARTPLHNFLNAQNPSHEREQMRDWFDRAYNRMTARSQGATAYLSILAENVSFGDGSEGEAVASLDAPMSIEAVGAMPSEEFARVHERLSPISQKWKDGGEINIKRDVFDELRASVGPESFDALQVTEVGESHLLKKMLAFSTVEKLAASFIGKREAGPRNYANANVQTRSSENSTESSLELTPR